MSVGGPGATDPLARLPKGGYEDKMKSKTMFLKNNSG